MAASDIQAQKMNFSRCIAPQAIVDAGSWTCYAVDTNGCKAVHCLIHLGASDIAMAALKVQESDALSSATALNTGTDIALGDFSVSPATLPSATADNTFLLVSIPVTGARKRYFNLVATAGDGSNGTFITACWIKESLDEAPNTATKRGLGQHLIVAG
jgi:hypothetical protein